MNREVKFKYLYTDGKNWITKVFTLEEIVNSEPFEVLSDSPFVGSKNYNHVGRVQWTGLKDKNGKEIFEGDILAYGRDYFNNKVLNPGNYPLEVYYTENASYEVRQKKGVKVSIPDLRADMLWKFEVIGNIYETPELINQ